MEKKLIPAPIDEKNITSDWIEEIFDNYTCTWRKDCAVGFINNVAVMAAWSSNILMWKFMEEANLEESYAVLKDRLSRYDGQTSVIEKKRRVGNMLIQQFFFEDE